MKNYWKLIIIVLSVLLVGALGWGAYLYMVNQKSIEQINICQDDELVARLIVNNVNPFSKFKFIKKRNSDCNVLMVVNKDDAINTKSEKYCSVIDSSSVSLILLINTYVNDMYDRESASAVFKKTTPLMIPYNYCPQYMDNMIDLIKLKRRLGL